MKILQLTKIAELLQRHDLNFNTLNSYSEDLREVLLLAAEAAQHKDAVECKCHVKRIAELNNLRDFIDEAAEAIG